MQEVRLDDPNVTALRTQTSMKVRKVLGNQLDVFVRNCM